MADNKLPSLRSDSDDYLPAWEQWKSNPTPQGNAAFVKAVQPILDSGIKSYAGGSALAGSQAKVLAIHAARTFDPAKAKLSTHLHNQLQQLQRLSRQQTSVLRAPERILLEGRTIKKQIEELRDQYGREPSDAEIATAAGIPLARLQKVRSYSPGINTGRVAQPTAEGDSGAPAVRKLGVEGARDHWVQLVYDELDPVDQRILEMTLGLHGQPKRSNQDVAQRLKLSPAAITQRKARIQRKLDREQELSPFST
jgi:DNA-directed RNA polymerase specialized sigma subunit